MIMFAGAGSVGKTSLLKECEEMVKEYGITMRSCLSTTRDTYARHGLDRESEALKDPEFNMKMQHEVMADNIVATEEGVRTAEACVVNLVVADRTPYDYAGYFFTVFQDRLDLKTITEKRRACDEAILRLFNIVDEIHIILLPYPAWWSRDTESSDGWRADMTGKNFVWSSVVEAELRSAERRLKNRMQRFGTNRKLTIERMSVFAEYGTPNIRAAEVLGKVFPDWGKRSRHD